MLKVTDGQYLKLLSMYWTSFSIIVAFWWPGVKTGGCDLLSLKDLFQSSYITAQSFHGNNGERWNHFWQSICLINLGGIFKRLPVFIFSPSQNFQEFRLLTCLRFCSSALPYFLSKATKIQADLWKFSDGTWFFLRGVGWLVFSTVTTEVWTQWQFGQTNSVLSLRISSASTSFWFIILRPRWQLVIPRSTAVPPWRQRQP